MRTPERAFLVKRVSYLACDDIDTSFSLTILVEKRFFRFNLHVGSTPSFR